MIYNNSIWSIDRILSGATTPGQSEPGSNGNERVLCIHQSSCITEASPSDCLLSYPGPSFRWGSYLTAEMQSFLSAAPADSAIKIKSVFKKYQDWSCIYQDKKWTMNDTIFCPIIVGKFVYTIIILNITSIMGQK